MEGLTGPNDCINANPVRVERSRDMSRGVSTTLDTNGRRVLNRKI